MYNSMLAAFGMYLISLIVIGIYSFKRHSTAQEFMLGSRSLGYLATAIATHSSDMSIWLFMGLPALAYTQGIPACWITIGLVIGMYATWQLVAGPLRRETERYHALTLIGYLKQRFNDDNGLFTVTSSFLLLLFFVFYISSGLVGMGRMLESVFNLDYHLGVLMSLSVTVIYTLLGGFAGIAACDLFQGLFLEHLRPCPKLKLHPEILLDESLI